MKYHVDFSLDFRRNPYKGRYFVVEGIDGSGKTTQIEILARHFQKLGQKVVVTSEPRRKNSLISKLIHQILQKKVKVPSESLQYLYCADRVINHQTVVEPALRKGKIVLSHRCFWSSIPYGVFDRGIYDYNCDQSKVLLTALGILSMYHQFILPDKTFFLKVSVKTAIKRMAKMEKEKEFYEEEKKLAKISEGYDWLAKEFPKEITVIDGESPVEEISRDIIKEISKGRNP